MDNGSNKSDLLLNLSEFKTLMMRDLCANTNIIETGSIGEIPLQDAILALKHPKQGWRILLDVSETLMRVSPQYYRLNNLFSNMAIYDYTLNLYDIKDNVNIKNLKKIYQNLSAKLDSMCLKHEFQKIMKVLPYQDVFCGLVVENSTDFFIQQLNFKVCKLYEVQDGLYNFIINLSTITPQKLNAYPDYVRQAYNDFKEGKISSWYKPPVDKQICIKLNSQWTYPFPLLIGLVKDILDLDVYKKLKLQSARTDNYKAIMTEIPIDETTIDKPLITPETLSIFAEMNRENLTDDIGMIYNLGSSGEAISFKNSSNTRNNVEDAILNIYDSAGISKELYNGSSSGTAVTLSIENTSAIVYSVYRQFERWINRYIKTKKYNKPSFKFNFELLNITIFNKESITNTYKEACTLGINVIDKYMASLGMTPSNIFGSNIIHENIFEFNKHFMPLSSTYTASGNGDEGGRPTNAEQGKPLDVSGEVTANADSNIDR